MKKQVLSFLTVGMLMYSPTSFAATFSDVSTGAWYSTYVSELTDAGVGFGTDSSHYAPDKPITRGEVAQLIYNAEGKPSVTGSSGFSDVVNSPYATAIAYSQQQGIINGYPDGTFRPNATITRQELAKMLWNFFSSESSKFPSALQLKPPGDKPLFSDSYTFQGWGAEGIVELTLNGVLNGYPNGNFEPNGNVTRAEATKMMDVALQKVGYAFVQAQTSNNLKDNGDGTQSPANVTIPKEDIGSAFTPSLQTEIKNLMSEVKFQVDGKNVTVTVPDTNDPNVAWSIGGYPDTNDEYDSSKGTTMVFKNTVAVGVWLQQPQNVGSGIYLTAVYKQINGQWTFLIN